MAELRGGAKDLRRAIVNVEPFEGQNIYGYSFNKTSIFLKITVAMPRFIATTKRVFEVGSIECHEFQSKSTMSFESNVDFETRFMVDAGVAACSWFELPASKYRIRGRSHGLTSRCQVEVDVLWTDAVSHAPEGQWADAPMRILSFDIECAGRKGCFPEPERDAVISNMIIRQCEKGRLSKIYSFWSLAAAHVMSFPTEG